MYSKQLTSFLINHKGRKVFHKGHKEKDNLLIQ